MSIDFKAGDFVSLRATTKFHLGALERDLAEGDVVQFDGSTVRIDGKDHTLPVMKGAVRAGWLVPADDTTSKYTPRASDVAVRPALGQDRDNGKTVAVKTVLDEERDLGNLNKVRDHGDGIVRKAKIVQEDGGDGGIPVGKLRSAANQKTTLTAENAMRVAQDIRRMDNVEGTPEKRVIPAKAIATGDVQEARAADSIDELFDDLVATAGKPPAGPAGEGDDPGLTTEEKDEKATRLAAAKAAADAARASRLAQVGAPAPTPAPPVKKEIVVDSNEAPGSGAEVTARFALVRAVLPDFAWDLTRPWKQRVADGVKLCGKDPVRLYGVLVVETDTVRSHITTFMNKSPE